MFDTDTDNRERGQVGIGTLIVFIALVLVAAIAAGVLINTAGFLQTQAQATGEESTDQVSTNLVFLSTTGVIDGDEEGIDRFDTTVQLGPGSSAVDLDDATISVFTDDGFSAEFDGIEDGDEGIFLVDGGDTVLSTDAGDDGATATIAFSIADAEADDQFDGEERFEAGTSIDVVITTAEGTQAENTFSIEDPLDPQVGDGDRIRLG